LEAPELKDWSQLRQRLQAVAEFSSLPESQALASANKRISNILKKTHDPVDAVVDPLLFIESAEHALHTQLETISANALNLYMKQDYRGSFTQWYAD
jgi:glycyl-tRNA synthetase beta chain